MRAPDSQQLTAVLEELRELVDQLERGIPLKKTRTPNLAELLRRARTAVSDGYPTRSLGGGSSGSRLDADGEPSPPNADPVGELVVNALDHTVSDPVGRQAQTAIRGITGAIGDLRMARDALSKAFIEKNKPAVIDPDSCRNHASNDTWEPVHRNERCRFCYDFWLANSTDAPAELLDARGQGRRITQRMVDLALKPAMRKRRRKAG